MDSRHRQYFFGSCHAALPTCNSQLKYFCTLLYSFRINWIILYSFRINWNILYSFEITEIFCIVLESIKIFCILFESIKIFVILFESSEIFWNILSFLWNKFIEIRTKLCHKPVIVTYDVYHNLLYATCLLCHNNGTIINRW